MMRIGLVTGEYPPMEGGVGAFTQELAKALAEQGHFVAIFTHREARAGYVKRSDDRARALLEPIELSFAELYTRGRRWWWGEMDLIAEWVLRYELDVVNIQYQAAAYNMRVPAINWLPWRLRRLTRVVVTYHDLRTPYLWPKAGRLRPFVVRQMGRMAAGAIVTNREDYEALTAAVAVPVAEIPIGSNVMVHEVGVERVATVRRELGVPEGGALLAYFGFLNRSKGADRLLAALAEMGEDVHLVFIGGRTGASDPDNNRAFFEEIDGQIEALGLGERVHWTGFVADEAVSAYLEAAEVVVLPYRDGVSL
ncbi:MAG TPA: glycosyltransferase family 4 protein, partial [Anaerolineae bacterium]|nr:glycosyltransferase family 4 protein [Anaerolineae bacterium]